MTPELSPFPIAVTKPLPLNELKSFVEDMRRAKIPYVIVKDRYKHPEARTEKTKRKLCSLWRAQTPDDEEFAGRQGQLSSFRGYIERGKADGPKPGTKAWDGKIVETWGPEKEER